MPKPPRELGREAIFHAQLDMGPPTISDKASSMLLEPKVRRGCEL